MRSLVSRVQAPALFCLGLVLGVVAVATANALFQPRMIGADSPSFDPSLLLMQVQAMAAQFGPWGILIAAGIGIYLRFFRKTPSPSPASPSIPNGPTPGPTDPPATPSGPLSNRPILNWLLQLMSGVAVQKYPELHPEEALGRHMAESVAASYSHLDKAAEEGSTKK